MSNTQKNDSYCVLPASGRLLLEVYVADQEQTSRSEYIQSLLRKTTEQSAPKEPKS